MYYSGIISNVYCFLSFVNVENFFTYAGTIFLYTKMTPVVVSAMENIETEIKGEKTLNFSLYTHV